MDGCRTEIPIQLKTCKSIQSCCFGTRPTSSPGHSADRQEPMVAQKTHYENKCKIIPANTNKKANLFVFGEYEYERIRGGPYSLRIIRLVQKITNIRRIRIRTNIGRLSLFANTNILPSLLAPSLRTDRGPAACTHAHPVSCVCVILMVYHVGGEYGKDRQSTWTGRCVR
jgi:hypothetical protein